MSRVQEFEQGKRIARGLIYSHIAMHGGDGFELNFGRCQHEQDCQRIVSAGVGV